jgi:copper chaperone CopZ
MRPIVQTVPVILLILGLTVPLTADSRPETVRTVFQVTGMHCDGCSSAITAALQKTSGVIEASADHEKGVAEAIYHPRKVEVEELKNEIEKLGYTVTGMETETVNPQN